MGVNLIYCIFLFLWQIYAINKRSYDTARQILVIKVVPGTCERVIVKSNEKEHKGKRFVTDVSQRGCCLIKLSSSSSWGRLRRCCPLLFRKRSSRIWSTCGRRTVWKSSTSATPWIEAAEFPCLSRDTTKGEHLCRNEALMWSVCVCVCSLTIWYVSACTWRWGRRSSSQSVCSACGSRSTGGSVLQHPEGRRAETAAPVRFPATASPGARRSW